MRRRAARTDANQVAIVDALRKIGCRVLPLHAQGMGCPDLIAARGKTIRFLELKDGEKPPSARRLTPLELKFYDDWFPHVIVVNSADEAINAMVSA